MVAGVGLVHGAGAVAFASDPRVQGGAMGTAGCAAIVGAYTEAVSRGVPIVGLWHSGGARLAEGVASLHAVGTVFAAMTAASGRVPQISVVLGPAAGGAAYGPALTDIVILSGQGRIFVTGPDVVRSVTGEDVDMERLGGPEPHSRRSGVVHLVTETDAEALDRARQVAALFSDQGKIAEDAEDRDLSGVLPDSARRAYDVHLLTGKLLDSPGVELHPRWAPNIVTILGRLAGRTVGVVASNPMRLGGCLDAAAAEKAARFVRMCDAFGVPLVVLVDVPGYLPGVGQEWDGVVRRGAKLLHAFAEASGATGDAGDPQGVRRGLHRDELPLAGRDPRLRLAGRRGGRHGRGRGHPYPAPPHAGLGAAGAAARGRDRTGRRARGHRGRPEARGRTRRHRRHHRAQPDAAASSSGPSPRPPSSRERTPTSRCEPPAAVVGLGGQARRAGASWRSR